MNIAEALTILSQTNMATTVIENGVVDSRDGVHHAMIKTVTGLIEADVFYHVERLLSTGAMDDIAEYVLKVEHVYDRLYESASHYEVHDPRDKMWSDLHSWVFGGGMRYYYPKNTPELLVKMGYELQYSVSDDSQYVITVTVHPSSDPASKDG